MFGKSLQELFLVTFTLLTATAQSLQFEAELTYPRPTAEHLLSVASAPLGFVATGFGNQILFSPDGLNWQVTFIEGRPWVLSAAFYFNGTYIAAGNNGIALRSHDGKDWEPIPDLPDVFLGSGIGAEGKFVLVGSSETNGVVLVSPDARDWDVLSTDIALRDITYGNGLWVGLNGTPYHSLDLTNWIPAINGARPPFMRAVTFGNNRFVAVGAWDPDNGNTRSGSVILYSDTGTNWNFASRDGFDSFGEIQDVTFANGQFIATRDSRIFHSTNGINWTIVESGAAHNLRGVAGSPDGTFLAVGALGEIIRSTNITHWQGINTAPRDWILGIEFIGGRFLAVAGTPTYIAGPPGSSAVFSSIDGVSWHASLTNGSDQLTGATYGNGLWVVTGDDGQIFTSTNTLTWENRSLPPTLHDLRSVHFGNGHFVAFSLFRDLIYHSTNGVVWASREVPGLSTNGVTAFLNGTFVALGNHAGEIMTSLDGLEWDVRSTAINVFHNAITYGGGKYVAGGVNVIQYSTDLTNWIAVPTSFITHDLEFIDGQFVAFTFAGAFASSNAVDWLPVDLQPNILELTEAAVGNGIVVASDGRPHLYRLLTPGSPKLAVRHTANEVRISWPSQQTTVVLEYAVNLDGPWIEASETPELLNGEFVLQQNSSIRARYFRLKL
jgi:hypothetical protein